MTIDQIDQSLKKENLITKGNWWNETFKQSVIKEEEGEEKSVEREDTLRDSVFAQDKTASLIKT